MRIVFGHIYLIVIIYSFFNFLICLLFSFLLSKIDNDSISDILSFILYLLINMDIQKDIVKILRILKRESFSNSILIFDTITIPSLILIYNLLTDYNLVDKAVFSNVIIGILGLTKLNYICFVNYMYFSKDSEEQQPLIEKKQQEIQLLSKQLLEQQSLFKKQESELLLSQQLLKSQENKLQLEQFKEQTDLEIILHSTGEGKEKFEVKEQFRQELESVIEPD